MEKVKKIDNNAKNTAKKATEIAKLNEINYSNTLTATDKDGINVAIKAVDDSQKKLADRIAELELALRSLQDRIPHKTQ